MAKVAAIGFLSSSLAMAVSHPADTISRQLQVTSREKVAGTQGLRYQGIRGLYKGIGPALITQPTYWACFFPCYEAMKAIIVPTAFYGRNRLVSDMAMSFSAGAIATVVTNPLWMLRQRMQTELVKQNRAQVTYTTLVREIYAENGAVTFFRGTSITLVKNVQMAFLLPIFERLRDYDGWEKTGLPAPMIAGLSGAVAKIVSSSGVYPLDVIRTNLRVQVGKRISMWSITRELVFQRPGGIRNLYRGIGWYWMSSASMFAVMMTMHSVLIEHFK